MAFQTCLFAVLQASLVRRLLDVFVHVSSTNQLFRAVPHGQPCCGVVKKYTVITRPHHTPNEEEKHFVLVYFTVISDDPGLQWMPTKVSQVWGWWLRAWPSELPFLPPSSLPL